MPAEIRVPKFGSEREEAEWWDAHPEVITRLFLQAKKAGKLKRLPLERRTSKSVTIRLAVNDLETAHQLAERRGLPYQTLIKMLLHQALEKERRAS